MRDFAIETQQSQSVVKISGTGVYGVIRMHTMRRLAAALVVCSAHWLSGCGGGGSSPSFTVTASVSGLTAGQTVVLADNGSDNLSITANGTSAFHTLLGNGAQYAVTVLTQPVGENCAVTSSTGTIPNSNVTVAVVCTVLSYTIGGSVSGLLPGNSIVLNETPGIPVRISANGPYTVGSPLPSGTAYAVSINAQPNGETCTIANGAGTLSGANATNVDISCNANPYSISVNVVGLLPNSNLILQNNGGDNLTVTTGGLFPFSAPIASGSAYSVTIATQPSGQTCTVVAHDGTVAGAAVTLLVTCPWHVLYAATPTGLNGFAIDPTSGALAQLPGTPINNFPFSYLITASSGQNLYTIGADVTSGGDVTSSFSINPNTGVLTQLAGSPYLDSTNVAGVDSVLINPSNTFGYALDGSGTVFSINSNTGLLTPTGSTQGLQVGATAKAESAYANCSIRPDGRFAYCPDGGPGAGEVTEYSLDPTSGVATEVGSVFLGTNPVLISITPNGNFAYAMQPDGISSVISGFSIDGVSGSLTPIVGSPFSVPTTPTYLVGGINNNALYVHELGSIVTYSIGSLSGALSLQTGTIATLGGISNSLALDPSGKFIYFVGGLGLSGASIDENTGALTLLPGSPFVPESDGQRNSFAIAPIIH